MKQSFDNGRGSIVPRCTAVDNLSIIACKFKCHGLYVRNGIYRSGMNNCTTSYLCSCYELNIMLLCDLFAMTRI